MSSRMLRGLLIVLLSILVARYIWLAVAVRETGKTVGKVQIKLAINDVKRIREVLDFLSGAYSLGERDGKTYKTNNYTAFKDRIQRIADSLGGMPMVLPDRPNFTDFSYTESTKGYHIKVSAKGSSGTVVHATQSRLWHE
ncbi:MAG: hypothetical protein JRI70_08660 [Deltaproteobacteria bacterium]|nr:hypothetical protein [Deltaproteobacteria bacterium]MBW2172722.1 hypothetical protein [Deltaproteobacteria bacterium]